MAKAFIQFYTKSGSLFSDRVEINTELLPRVGEIIDANEFYQNDGSQVRDFMVMSVIYKLTPNGFAAYISARQWLKGFRHELLKERGWLNPENTTYLSYDEDDAARWEKVD